MSTFNVVFQDTNNVDRSFEYPGFVHLDDATIVAERLRHNMIVACRKGQVVVQKDNTIYTRLPVRGNDRLANRSIRS